MWDGFVPVDTSYAPPVYEGAPAIITVHNAGPGTVVVEVWDSPPSEPARERTRPNRVVQLRAGDTRTVTAGMVVVKYEKDADNARTHAAVGWRLMGVVRWMP